MNNPVIVAKGLTKTFHDGTLHVEVLTGVDLAIQAGETVAIIGSSGSGKSTLLHLLGGLDTPSSGQVWVDNIPFARLNEKQKGQLRNQKLGFVYQFHHLLPEFTALENVAMPLLIRNTPHAEANQKAAVLLQKVGLGKRLHHKPAELSGGERQRTAIARALVTSPVCVLADEPTGNLDNHTSDQVYEVLLALNKEMNTSLVIVTHDQHLANRMGRILELKEGQVQEL